MRRASSGAGPVRLEIAHGGDVVYGEDYGAASSADFIELELTGEKTHGLPIVNKVNN